MQAATNIIGTASPVQTLANAHDSFFPVGGVGVAGRMSLTRGLPTKKISLWCFNIIRTALVSVTIGSYRSGFSSITGDMILKKNGTEIMRLPFAASAKYNGDFDNILLNGNGYVDDSTAVSIGVNGVLILNGDTATKKVNGFYNSVDATALTQNAGMVALPASQLNTVFNAFIDAGNKLKGVQYSAPCLEISCDADTAEFLVKTVDGLNWVDLNTPIRGFLAAAIICSVIETSQQISQMETAYGLN